MRLDGGGEQQITHTPKQEALPNWSPTGDAIAFGYLDTGFGVWVVRRDANGRWGEPVLRRRWLDPHLVPGWSIGPVHRGATGGQHQMVPADSARSARCSMRRCLARRCPRRSNGLEMD
jgi:hypothetical protein